MLVAAAKSVASSMALVLPIAQAPDLLSRGRGCMMTFHRAAPSQAWEALPNRDFYLDLGFLDQFLSYLKQNKWDVVTVEEALRRAASGDDNRRYVNFSVDDCYRDTFEQVVPLFRSHGVPVTLFVTTGIPDKTLPLWAAGLEDALLHRDRVVLEDQTLELADAESRRAAYNRIATRWDGPEAGDHYAAFCQQNGIDIDAMHWKHAISWEMLEALRDDPLVEIGAHTVSHARIAALSPGAALDELQGCRQRLSDRLGIAIRHFAFPYGRANDCGPRDFALARQAGFASAATTRKGLVGPGQDAFDLPRNTINGGHRNLTMMQLHLSGLTGAAARMMGRV
jgi:peptidoglycan/xylan/chitin deacetylase (PgdA/CDA1 family)